MEDSLESRLDVDLTAEQRVKSWSRAQEKSFPVEKSGSLGDHRDSNFSVDSGSCAVFEESELLLHKGAVRIIVGLVHE